MRLIVTSVSTRSEEPEIVERKGRGHPDTLADNLAEHLSASYCDYTRNRFGEILNHNFDKVGLLGGRARVSFGEGSLLDPIRVLLNGRAADRFQDISIPLRELMELWCREFFDRELPLINSAHDLAFYYNVSTSNTAGYPEDDFRPQSNAPNIQREGRLSSDTAALCAYFPRSPLEDAVNSIERLLTRDEFRAARPWLGSDIKLLAVRFKNEVDITCCVPQVARFVESSAEYATNLCAIRKAIEEQLADLLPQYATNLTINTKDVPELDSYYLTAIGSCIESGDEGMVGRGNRPNGLIAIGRPFSGEAACGKNPLFFPGKVYNSIAITCARRLYEQSGVTSHVWLVAQEGRPLSNPWWAMVAFEGAALDERLVEQTICEELQRVSLHSEALIEGKVGLC
jgi:S-adenosylmethionine synthetase